MAHALEFRPQHRLFAVFGDSRTAASAERFMMESGIARDDITRLEGEAGRREIDLTGKEHGVQGRVVRTVQRTLSADYDYLAFLDDELGHGHIVLAVHADDAGTADRLARTLRQFDGEGFAYFRHWDFDPVAA